MPSKLYDLAWIREKTAARWDKLMQAGQLAGHDVARLQAHAGASDKAGIQKSLQSFSSPLSPEQLDRHESFHEKVLPHFEKFHGFEPASKSPVGQAGPHLDIEGNAYSDPETMRKVIEDLGFTPTPSMQRQALNHERQEQRMRKALNEHRYVPHAPGDNHLGPGAVIADRLGALNPATHEFYSYLRSNPQAGAVERGMAKKLKQFGGVGNYMPPLGGRVHRSLDAAVHPEASAAYAPIFDQLVAQAAKANTPSYRRILERPASALGFDINKKYRDEARPVVEQLVDQLGFRPRRVEPHYQAFPMIAQNRVRNFIATQSGG